MNRLIACAAVAVTGASLIASGESALTRALKNRQVSPIPFIAAQIEKENEKPKTPIHLIEGRFNEIPAHVIEEHFDEAPAHPLKEHFENPKLVPAHLQRYLKANKHFLAGDNSTASTDDDNDPELEKLAATSPSIAIPSPTMRSMTPSLAKACTVAKALELAIKIQTRKSPITLS